MVPRLSQAGEGVGRRLHPSNLTLPGAAAGFFGPSVTDSFLRRTLPFFLSLAFLAVVHACDSGVTGPPDPPPPAGGYEDPPDPPDLPPPPDTTSTGGILDCEQLDFPCLASQTDPAAMEQSIALGQEAVQRHRSGDSMASIRSWLAGTPGVVEVGGEGDVLRFRLVGGRSVWVLGEEARKREGGVPGAPAYGAVPGPAASPGASTGPYPVVARRQPVVPEPKSALVLAPFEWEWGTGDDAWWVRDHLREVRGYRAEEGGSVTYRENADAGVDAFRGWTAHDVIHVSTHGGVDCTLPDDRCISILMTGTRGVSVQQYLGMEEGLDLTFITVEGESVPYLSVTGDFFRAHYPNGLERAVIVMSACSSTGNPDIGLHLMGSSSVYIGWSDVVYLDEARAATEYLFSYLTEHGVTARRAFTQLRDAGLAEGRDARLTAGGAEVRIRETITLLDVLAGTPLEDAAAVPAVGQPDDGVPDGLPVLLTLDGVHPDEVGGYTVRLLVNGIGVGEWGLDHPRMTKTGDYDYLLRDNVQLTVDVSQGQPLELEARVLLHEGGDSRQEVVPVVENPVLELHSIMSQVPAPGWEARSEIRGEVALGLVDDPESIRFEGDTEVEYTHSMTLPPGEVCSVSVEYWNFDIRIRDLVLPLDGTGEGPVAPERMRFETDPGVSEIRTFTCPEVPPLVQPSGHWWAAWGVSHLDEWVPAEGGWWLEGWQPLPGPAYAELVYDRPIIAPGEGPIGTEYTRFLLRRPD